MFLPLFFLRLLLRDTILFLLILLLNILHFALIPQLITAGCLDGCIVAFHILLAFFLHQHFSLYLINILFSHFFLDVVLLYLVLEDISYL